MNELPIRFGVHPSFALPTLDSETKIASIDRLSTQELRTTYYDTDDLRLARFGVTLRQEAHDGTSNWLLKVPTDDEDVIVAGESRLMPVLARELVTAFARTATIGAVGALQTRRRTWVVRKAEGSSIAELADVEVSLIRKGRVSARFRELELHDCEGGRRRLKGIARALRRAGAVAAEPISSKTRALGPWAEAPSDVPEPNGTQPPDSVEAVVQNALASGARRIMLNDPGTRLGDTEALHQMRVGARRLRSDLGTFNGLVDRDWTEPLVAELRWLGDCLGRVCDLDVMNQRLRQAAKEAGIEAPLAPFFDEIESQREGERTSLLETLSGRRYVTLLDSLVQAAAAPATSKKAAADVRRVLPKLVHRRYRKLAKSVGSLHDGAPNEAWHKGRIRAKRARYAAEAVAPALGKKREAVVRLAKNVAKLQDLLGTLQDSATASEMLRDCGERHALDGGLNLAAGRLIEHESHAAEQARAKFQKQWDNLDLEKHLRRLSPR